MLQCSKIAVIFEPALRFVNGSFIKEREGQSHAHVHWGERNSIAAEGATAPETLRQTDLMNFSNLESASKAAEGVMPSGKSTDGVMCRKPLH